MLAVPSQGIEGASNVAESTTERSSEADQPVSFGTSNFHRVQAQVNLPVETLDTVLAAL